MTLPYTTHKRLQIHRIMKSLFYLAVGIICYFISITEYGDFEIKYWGIFFILYGLLKAYNFIIHTKPIQDFISNRNISFVLNQTFLGYDFNKINENTELEFNIFSYIFTNLLIIDLYYLIKIREYIFSILLFIIFAVVFSNLFFIYIKYEKSIKLKNKLSLFLFLLSWLISMILGFYYFDMHLSTILLVYILQPLLNLYYIMLQAVGIIILVYIIQDADLQSV